MKKRSLGINALLNGFRNVLNLLFPLITFPYVSHILSVEGIGINNFSNTYVGYFSLIAGLGISTYAVREGAKYRDNLQKIEHFSNEIFSINMGSTLIAYILLIVSLLLFFKSLKRYILCILIYAIQIFFTTIGTDWIYTIYEDYAYITVRNIIFKIISIVLLFTLVKNSSDYLLYAAITVIATVGSNIFNYFHAKKYIHLKIIRSVHLKYNLKPILTIFASAIAVNIYVFSDTTLLGFLKNDYAVGIYSISTKFFTITQSLLTAILTVTIPRLALLYGQHRLKEYHKILSKVINVLCIMVFPVAIGLIMLSKEVILMFAGRKYLNSVLGLQILSWAIIFSIFSWLLSDCVLIPAKREKYVLRGTIITAVFNVLFNLIFIPKFSYNATSLSTVLSEILVMLLNFYYGWDIVREIIKSEIFINNIITSIFGCLGIVSVCLIVPFFIKQFWIKIILSIFLSIIIYGVVLLALKNEVIKELFYLIKERKIQKK